jgi:hypothetical protein
MFPYSFTLSQPSAKDSDPFRSVHPLASLTNKVMRDANAEASYHHQGWTLFSSPFFGSEATEGTYSANPIYLDNSHVQVQPLPIYPPHDPSRPHDPFMFYSTVPIAAFSDPSPPSSSHPPMPPFISSSSSYPSPQPFVSPSFDMAGNSEFGCGVGISPYAAAPAATLAWEFGNVSSSDNVHFGDFSRNHRQQAPVPTASGDGLYGVFGDPISQYPQAPQMAPFPAPPHSTSPCATQPVSSLALLHSAPSTPYSSSRIAIQPQEPVQLHHPRPQRPISVSHIRVSSASDSSYPALAPVPAAAYRCHDRKGKGDDPGNSSGGGGGLSPLSLLCQPVPDSVLLEACKPFAGSGNGGGAGTYHPSSPPSTLVEW